MAKTLEFFVLDLISEFKAHAFGFRGTFASAGAVTARLLQTFLNELNYRFIRVKCYLQVTTSLLHLVQVNQDLFCVPSPISRFYLDPLSYGIPSAFGARDFFDVKMSTIREMMYGNMLYTPPGMFRLVSQSKPK